MQGATLTPPKSRALGFGEDSDFGMWKALGAALLLHAGLMFVETHQPGAPAKGEILIDLEMAVAPPAPLPAEPPVPPETPPADTLPSPTPVVPSPSPSVAAPVTDAEPIPGEGGTSEEDSAAEMVASDFGSSDFAVLSGSGSALSGGRMGLPGRGGRSSAQVLASRDLSRNAIAPDLTGLVLRNYPVAARLARVEGTVTVSATIDTDGNPKDVRVERVTPSGRGFGETCSRTVHQGPDWKPKLNRDGRPVTSRAVYTCRFILPEGTVPADLPTTGVGANRVWTKPAGG